MGLLPVWILCGIFVFFIVISFIFDISYLIHSIQRDKELKKFEQKRKDEKNKQVIFVEKIIVICVCDGFEYIGVQHTGFICE